MDPRNLIITVIDVKIFPILNIFSNNVLQIFLVYWQKCNSLEKLVNLCHKPQNSAGVESNSMPVKSVVFVAVAVVLVLISVGVVLLIHHFGFYETLLPVGIFDVSFSVCQRSNL